MTVVYLGFLLLLPDSKTQLAIRDNSDQKKNIALCNVFEFRPAGQSTQKKLFACVFFFFFDWILCFFFLFYFYCWFCYFPIFFVFPSNDIRPSFVNRLSSVFLTMWQITYMPYTGLFFFYIHSIWIVSYVLYMFCIYSIHTTERKKNIDKNRIRWRRRSIDFDYMIVAFRPLVNWYTNTHHCHCITNANQCVHTRFLYIDEEGEKKWWMILYVSNVQC